MPRTKTDYSRTVIYVIKCKDDNITEEYVGSTTDFIERKCSHKTACNNEKSKKYNYKIYKFIRENGGWDNWIMLEVEKYPCNDKREAEKREEEIRIDRKAKLNMRKAFVAETKEEYYKQYNEANKEIIKSKKKVYREANKEENKLKDKKYYEEHKEERNEYNKKYYEEHKDRKWTCTICNKEMRELSKNRHNKRIHLEENKISI